LKPVEGVSFDPVYFKFDSTAVPEAEKSKIESVYKDLAENDSHVVVVEGHCDERGANDYNMSLGENRSGIIRDYLVRLGVNADRIQTKSWGEEKPAVAGSNETAWAKNRRAEFSLFQK
jgi:peptidoglycan-associated lipoprotein